MLFCFYKENRDDVKNSLLSSQCNRGLIDKYNCHLDITIIWFQSKYVIF